MRRLAVVVLALLCIGAAAWAEDEGGFKFQAGIVLGTDVIVIPGTDQTETWNVLGFQPDLGFGKFGIGFDLSMRFQLGSTGGEALVVYPGDWVPDYEGSGKSFLDLYLPKIMYLRYGFRGDPLFAKLGSVDDLTLGNGFIVGNYSNTKFLPSQRIFGLQLNLDGEVFGFPYVGLELLTGNLAQLDVIGGRFFVRPHLSTGLPILEDLQPGATVAADTKPELYIAEANVQGNGAVAVYGADLFLPLIKSKAFPLAAFSELAFQPKGRTGFMVGAGGRLASVITYGAQIRALSAGFIPVYFDANYDLFRAIKSDIMESTPSGDGTVGWLAKAGASLFNDSVFFDISVDGPFQAIPAVATVNPAEYPHIRAVAGVGEGLLGSFFFDFSYDKYFIGKANAFWEDLVDPTDAVIGAAVNFKSGAAVFTLLYNLRYNPATGDFDITSSLQSSIKF